MASDMSTPNTARCNEDATARLTNGPCRRTLCTGALRIKSRRGWSAHDVLLQSAARQPRQTALRQQVRPCVHEPAARMMGTRSTRGELELERLHLAPVCVSGQLSSLTSASKRATSAPSSATGPNGAASLQPRRTMSH
jgi:hypothetical protein